ncbi:GNAT family N-acetyltransferase [Leucobacter edaphi]|uniref:GNAT family N-acetyltransferase n=1 Tax=Leucobacter edaphi TaxID=2796472 RepID=UPI0034E1AF00
MQPPIVRRATPADLPLLEAIEREADLLFVERFAASDWPPPATGAARDADPGFLLVAELAGTVVGFAHVLEPEARAGDPDGAPRLAHLEQLSVSPAVTRRGIGSELLATAARVAHERGAELLTLRTYRDVPWNAPFYRARGFAEIVPDRGFLRELPASEHSEGIHAFGERVLLARELPAAHRETASSA